MSRKRSPQMLRVLKKVPSLAWLALQYDPPICKQAVSRWYDVPLDRVRETESITGIPAHEIRPDTFDPPATAIPERRRKADTAA